MNLVLKAWDTKLQEQRICPLPISSVCPTYSAASGKAVSVMGDSYLLCRPHGNWYPPR